MLSFRTAHEGLVYDVISTRVYLNFGVLMRLVGRTKNFCSKYVKYVNICTQSWKGLVDILTSFFTPTACVLHRQDQIF